MEGNIIKAVSNPYLTLINQHSRLIAVLQRSSSNLQVGEILFFCLLIKKKEKRKNSTLDLHSTTKPAKPSPQMTINLFSFDKKLECI